MIAIISVFFWILSLAAVFRLLIISNGKNRFRWPRAARGWLEFLFLFLLALLFLFRPHEDIFGGEDPGSYINSGITYNRQQQFFYIDELLSKVPPEARPSFYYGHAGYGLTKDACLWIRNADLAMAGPHFQPAYPLMAGFAAKIGRESWAPFVVPLFTIFTALALRALALRIFPHRWAGMLAFILYIFNPLTIWHGRCARPEIIAAFLLFGGLALVIYAWQNQPWRKTFDLVLGAACIGIAPLLHVTAWLLVIPAGMVMLVAILGGRNDFLPYGLVAILTTGMFYAETIHLTDYYNIRRFLETVFTHPWLIMAAFVLLAIISLSKKKYLGNKLGGKAALGKSWIPDQAGNDIHTPILPFPRKRESMISFGRFKFLWPNLSPSLCSGILFGTIAIVFLAVLIFNRQIFGDLPVLGRPVKNYFYITDFKVVANMLSLPMMLLILAGAIVWLIGPRENRKYRVLVFLIALPAILLAGNIHDFMMTRYLMVAFIPMAALFLTALAASVIPRAGWGKVIIIAMILCVIGLTKRTHLITTTEHKGFCRYLRPYAEIIKANKGILLCEYSRIAAPLEHFFGVPALGLDNERKNNYEQAETAWAGIMKSMPGRPAFFITPYNNIPLSVYFDFEPVFHDTFQDRRLEQARQSLPTKVGESTLTLRLFRMKLKQPDMTSTNSTSAPTIIKPDAGNMGLRDFANVRSEPITKQGADIHFGALDVQSLPEKVRQEAEALTAIPVPGTIRARWTRAHSAVLLPVSRKGPALLMIYLLAPDPAGSGSVSLQLTWGNEILEKREIRSEQWQWQVWQLPPTVSNSVPDVEWLGINVEPAWNPGKPNFPSDLGVLISRIICLPKLH